MYKVYCDKWLLHESGIEELKLVNPKLDLEVNKTGSFTFTIYHSHPYYKMLKKLKSIVTVYQNDEIIFRGRILNDGKGFHNEKQVICEGELAFLLDSTQRPYKFNGDIPELFTQFIDSHNRQVEEAKRFKVGKITVKDPNGYISRSDTQYLSTYDSIFKKLINTHGGYLSIRHEADGNYIDYLEDFTKLNSQDIELCKNLLDLKYTTKGEGIATVIIPLGAKINEKKEPEQKNKSEKSKQTIDDVTTPEERRLTIESVNNGKDYVYNEEAVNQYGWIAKVVIWDDVTLPENLFRKANETLANAFSFAKSLEVSAVDLSGTNKSISSYRVGTYNNVKSNLHDLEELLLVMKLSINLTNPKNDKMTLGKTFKSLTDQGKDDSNDIENKLDDILGSITDIKEVHQGTTPPEDKKLLWLDISLTPPLLKKWNGEEWIVVNDIGEEIKSLREELKSEISKTSEGIKMEVAENYYQKGETDSLVSSVSTKLDQTKEEFTFTFSGLNKDLEDLANDTNAEFKKIEEYIRFKNGNIEMGAVGSEFKQLLTKTKNSFLENGVEIAYFGNRKMYVTDGEYSNSLTIGNFAFIPRENGNLSFKKVR